MYIPHYYKQSNFNEIVAFVKKYNFGAIIGAGDNGMVATHLPFVTETENEKVVLYAHLAKANPHWESFADSEQLVIFNGPHAYISPTLYEKQQNVPTWNYTAVHIYGKAQLIEVDEDKIDLLKKTIEFYEPALLVQWENLDEKYIRGMLNAIVGFKIEATRVEAKFKLSQNKTPYEIKTIINYLRSSADANNIALADLMETTNKQ